MIGYVTTFIATQSRLLAVVGTFTGALYQSLVCIHRWQDLFEPCSDLQERVARVAATALITLVAPLNCTLAFYTLRAIVTPLNIMMEISLAISAIALGILLEHRQKSRDL